MAERASPVSPPTPNVPRTPGPRGAFDPRSPQRSPGSLAASQSPLFARTPHSLGSPLASPLGHSPTGSSPRVGRSPRIGASPVSARGSPRFSPVRGFLGSPRNHPINFVDGPDEAISSNFLYGTDINETQVVKDFHKFMQDFKIDGRAYYIHDLLKRWEAQQEKSKGIRIPIDASHIAQMNRQFYEHLVSFPTEVVPIIDRELWRISVKNMSDIPPDHLGHAQAQVHGLLPNDHKVMRLLNPEHIERLVSVNGTVIRCSDPIPDMTVALFRCTNQACKHEVSVLLNNWTIEEPTECEVCGTRDSFELQHNDCQFSDRQILKLQENPELVPDGETPQTMVIVCFDDNVDAVRPGDRVVVTGIFRASAVRPMRRQSVVNAVYRTYVDAISIVFEDKGAKTQGSNDDTEMALSRHVRPKLADEADLDDKTFSEEDIKWHRQIRALGAETDEQGNRTVGRKLVESFAPSIFEEDEVKRGLLCQLFGGTYQVSAEEGHSRFRAEINQLLCGDPSTAKSQLTQASYKLAPRGMYVSGKGCSAVGLTATINRDPLTQDLVLESGALVLADRGLCCIDEFDKMDDNARAVLHETMEQQSVSVAKSGVVCSLNARAAILASANPKDSAYNPKKSVVDNIHLPKNLMTRFDLIWLMLDKRNEETDERLAEHLLSMYNIERVESSQREPPVSNELMRRYIAFARRWVFPELTEKASKELVTQYMELRSQGGSRNVITATPRILEALIRLSQASAKMELREEVTEPDVAEAVRLLKAATYATAVDPETGLIDMEQLIAGMGAGRRKRRAEIDAMLGEVLAEHSQETLTMDKVRGFMNERLSEKKEAFLNDAEFMQALREAEDNGIMRRRGKEIELIN